MLETPRAFRKKDDDRININKKHEITYWTNELRTIPARLKLAVDAVGPVVRNVKAWLSINK